MRDTDRVRGRLLNTARRNPGYEFKPCNDSDSDKPYSPRAIIIFENCAYLDKPRVVGESNNL